MAKRVACLLIHGFGGNPFEMEPLAPSLEAMGYTVDIPTLLGHEGDIERFQSSYYPQWLEHAEQRFLALAKDYHRVVPIGFSMGGGIALTLAARHAANSALGAVCALAPPWQIYRLSALRLRTAWLAFTPLLRHFIASVPLPPPKPESRAIAPVRGYDRVLCLPQVHSLAQGMASMRQLLPALSAPLLLQCDARDSVCPPSGALQIARAVSSEHVLLRLYHMRENITSHHMLTTHRETRNAVARELADFVASRLA